MTSRTTRSTSSSANRRRASSPSRAWTTRHPVRSSRNVQSVCIESSSSTEEDGRGVSGMRAIPRARGCLPAYYSPAMEAARPRGRRRRPRRGTVSRPVNTRLVRVATLVIAPVCRSTVLGIDDGGPSAAQLDPLFDEAQRWTSPPGSTTENGSRSRQRWGGERRPLVPRRSPGLGLHTEEDVDRGPRRPRARRAAQRRRGGPGALGGSGRPRSPSRQHRRRPSGRRERRRRRGAHRARARLRPQESAPAALPERTLVLVSTDDGAWGRGARRFAQTSPTRTPRSPRSSSTGSTASGARLAIRATGPYRQRAAS